MVSLPRVTFWNEFRHEKSHKEVQDVYPQGLHAPIIQYLQAQGIQAVAATLDEPEHGLTEARLDQTDVLLWWGHMAHGEVQDEIVERVYQRVLKGMGLILLHSAHFSKIFVKLMGSCCNLKWREAGEVERLWVVNPAHPIVEGIGEYIELEHEEMYGELFDIPQPDELVFISWFEGGEVFRSGCCYTRQAGKVFYFRPGHETYRTYYHPEIQKVIYNAVRWAAPVNRPEVSFGHCPEPIVPFKK